MKNTILTFVFLTTLFLGHSKENTHHTAASYNDIQRVRINFTTPLGYVRHLLLAFTPNDAASDGFDYGYDGRNIDNFPDDMNWMIEDERFNIQGVGQFDDAKVYPVGMFLTNTGTVKIDLQRLENFDSAIEVYVYDSLNDSYTLINDSSFSTEMDSGEYLDRFYIAFSTNNNLNNLLLSVNEDLIDDLVISKQAQNQMITISHKSKFIDKIMFYDFNGKLLFNKTSHNTSSYDISSRRYQGSPIIIQIIIEGQLITKKILI